MCGSRIGSMSSRMRIFRSCDCNATLPGPMRRGSVALLLATVSFAQNFPAHTGFVNDFANQLSLADVQSLEQKVKDYERATGNEIAVAIVPSLNGMTIEEYAQGLFRSWGIGKYGRNNGVL